MNNKQKNIRNKDTAKQNPQAPVKQPEMSSRDVNIALLSGVAIFIFICFRYSLNNQFITDWDDWIYVTRDPYITSFTAPHVYSMLFQDITLNIYHPITMISLAVNYHFSQLNPMGYYFTNIMLHIINAILVFYLVKILMEAMVKAGYKAMQPIPWLVAVGALLHGIHPMHVESVSWVVERKDLLYTLFYFIGLIMYVRYTEGAKFKWMLYLNICLAIGCIWGVIGLKDFSVDLGHHGSLPVAIIFIVLLLLLIAAIVAELKFKKIKIELFYVLEFFLISLLSKPTAVAFPLSILVIDFLLKRDLKFISQGKGWVYNQGKALLNLAFEKWMFFLIVFLSGIITIFVQISVNSLVFTNGYTVIQKFLIACYTFTVYTIKAVCPIHLNSYYPFPNLTYEHFLPSVFYVVPLSAIAIVVIPLYLARKNKDLFRIVLFGLGFYFANIVFFLQFISSGTTIVSERYTYVAYFGLIFLFIYLLHWFLRYKPLASRAIKVSLAFICLLFGYLTYERTKVWHNPETLWTDAAIKDGDETQIPYSYLGSYYIDSSKYDKAYTEYAILVKLGTKDPLVYRNLAMIYGMRKQIDSSFFCFGKALQYDSTDASIYTNRAITYANLGKFDLALNDFNKAYKVDTTKNDALAQRAGMLVQVGRYNEAIADYTKLISREPKEPSFYLSRGNVWLNGGNAGMAIKDYMSLLDLQPKNAEGMYNISLAYHKLNDNTHALEYANLAQNAGYKLPDNYLNTLK